MRIEHLDETEWRRALPDRGAEVFHRPEALAVLADHYPGELRLLGGFKGDQPVALLPAFVRERSVGRVVTSPPPSFGVPRLGPLLMPTSPKQRKRERVNRRFTEGALDALDVDASLTLFRMLCPASYDDPRPYAWNDLDVRPQFTYRVDAAQGTEALMDGFSSSLRREIRDARDLDVAVEREGIDGAMAIFESTVDYFEQQGEALGMPREYVRDLFEALDERARAYVVRGPDGEYLSGITVLYSGDAAYFWQGGVRADYEGTSVNSLVHWRIMADIATGEAPDVTHYDLVGANTERLCEYKAKFGADVTPYYVVESGGTGMDLAKSVFRLAQSR
jgi:hypothetical protein